MRRGANAGGRSTPRLRGPVAALAVFAALSCGPLPTVAGAEPSRLVVCLYPNDSDGAPGVVRVNQAIRAVFAAESAEPIDLHNEYVATARLRDPAFKQALVAFLRVKYAGRKVDLVMAGLCSGLDFILGCRDEVFPGVPVVYMGVAEQEVAARRLPPDVTGVPTRMDLAGTLDLALGLHPDTRRVYVVAGRSAYDAAWAAESRTAFRPYEGRVEVVDLTGLAMDDLLRRVGHLPDHSLVYYLHVFEDGAGATLVPADALERIARAANAPVYGHVDTYVGRGIVGGRVFRFEAVGTHAARLGLRILAGERPAAIPVPGWGENAPAFDWRQLRRWGIREQDLPPGSVVLNKEPTLWDGYKWHVVGAGSFCVIEGLLIAGLLAQRVMRRRADERFRRVVMAAPTGMLLVARDGTVAMANDRAQALFGYGPGELVGRPVEQLLPDEAWARHPAARDQFIAGPDARPTGFGRDVFGRRKDRTEFPVEVELNPLRTPQGPFLLASVIDLTARRTAETDLRASRRDLQALTGRLLEAQEAERRRIARELHDDINQSLALLAVELDLLGRAPPGSNGRTAEQLAGLSARVKEVSSAVHDLSHQLHPSKLEHLGLLAAVRGLCGELNAHHGLDVRFADRDLPGGIPPATALCLYRIAQEALRNVARHSGTTRATVELDGTAAGIRLRVSDHGAGFDPAAVGATGGLGLVSMRERLAAVGGEIAIDSRPGGGTRIDAHVPLGPAGRANEWSGVEAVTT